MKFDVLESSRLTEAKRICRKCSKEFTRIVNTYAHYGQKSKATKTRYVERCQKCRWTDWFEGILKDPIKLAKYKESKRKWNMEHLYKIRKCKRDWYRRKKGGKYGLVKW